MGTDQNADNQSAIRPDEALNRRLQHIRHRIIVLSGKGGVGKSTVATNLAMALAHSGRRVGLLDVDLHGPSVPKLLHLEGSVVQIDHGNLRPVEVNGLKVMSVGFLLPERDSAVIWRADEGQCDPAVPSGCGLGRTRLLADRLPAGNGR